MRNMQANMDLSRRFTVQAFDCCELLGISINDLIKMKLEFPKYFNELFKDSRDILRKNLTLKFELTKHSEMESAADPSSTPRNALQSRFASHFLSEILKKMNETTTAARINEAMGIAPVGSIKQFSKKSISSPQRKGTFTGAAHCGFCQSVWGNMGCEQATRRNADESEADFTESSFDEEDERSFQPSQNRFKLIKRPSKFSKMSSRNSAMLSQSKFPMGSSTKPVPEGDSGGSSGEGAASLNNENAEKMLKDLMLSVNGIQKQIKRMKSRRR